jgi:predicted LPLAT superfamily acyltransferase
MDSEPSPAVSNARWDSRSVGKRWQFAFFAMLLRVGGRRLAYLFMYLVVAWYVLLRPFVRRRCRYYLDRRFPAVRNPLVRLWHDYRRIEALGESLIDRAAFGLLGPRALHMDFPEGLRLQELLEEGRGLIVLNSHVGCWQVAMSAFHYLRTRVSIVIHQQAADIDPRWFHGAGREVPFSIIDPAQPMGGVLQMIAALKENQILGLMGDRVFGNDPNTLPAVFLGAPVHFPVSPYRLASMQGTPIAVVFSHKTGFSSYRIELAHVIRVPAGLGRGNEAYAPYVQQMADALETFVAAHPWQFFNFHDMWGTPPVVRDSPGPQL